MAPATKLNLFIRTQRDPKQRRGPGGPGPEGADEDGARAGPTRGPRPTEGPTGGGARQSSSLGRDEKRCTQDDKISSPDKQSRYGQERPPSLAKSASETGAATGRRTQTRSRLSIPNAGKEVKKVRRRKTGGRAQGELETENECTSRKLDIHDGATPGVYTLHSRPRPR